ncbi:hypothetical protein [Streptomyces sp. Go-475]|uniref:hypothetical protein n=1 Tax=Streptomyces sp. Go-475 TaxID=2072505 RepID=UPI000DEF5AA7|nr:hypothetical protein [Streptomyces sp. Go-475]AXE84263.1 hypothetical protein C1703_04560 [Streptomyces sp. Go-475]
MPPAPDAAAAVIGALTVTACGGSGGSGDSVVDKPKAKASAKADSGQKAKKEAAPEVAKTGDTLALKGMENGSKLDVTVVKVVDHAKSQTTFAEVTAGPSMSSAVRLKPGAKALGWIVFEVPKTSKVATVQFAMDSGFAEQTGEWQLA